ncbi:MAG: lysine--tRNA ligase [Oscillospiraceae bacterium]|jgi:lysyl-tRNA synthetase class 2|nr:lysine--tRNA ligase [Oscillospiraceae bacterium]
MSDEILTGTAPEELQDLNEVMAIRRGKLDELKAGGQNPFEITVFNKRDIESIIGNFEALEGKDVSVAGRMMSRRDMGKANFIDVRDESAKIQAYVRVNDIGEESFAAFKKWDIGDIIGVEGFVFRTRRGEISVHAKKITLLSKSLRPLPEKFHGLRDTDLRYRQRYLDLIVNPEARAVFEKRSAIITEIRQFMSERGFLEVETPVLHSNAGGAAARPFVTHHNALNIDLYLRIALELHLKRLIVGGFERVYEIGRVFRNEGMDTRHNPEFTMLELYQAYTDYNGMMDIAEELFRRAAHKICGTGRIAFEGRELDLDKPFERLPMKDAVKRFTGVDFDALHTLEEARAAADANHVKYEKHHLKGDILNLFFEEFCEEKIIQPTFIMNHPVEISPLAKKCPDNPEYTERFELFIIGREYANAFSELNDPVDQRERFVRQAELKAAGDAEANDIDEDFISALEYGMPPTGGMGIGVDRLVMLLTNSVSIRDVLLFPTMKPIL